MYLCFIVNVIIDLILSVSAAKVSKSSKEARLYCTSPLVKVILYDQTMFNLSVEFKIKRFFSLTLLRVTMREFDSGLSVKSMDLW